VPEPIVILVSQISGAGHLDSYARLYSSCLLDLGYRVVLIAEHDPGIAQWLPARGKAAEGRFLFFKRDWLRQKRLEPGPTAPPGEALPKPTKSLRPSGAPLRRWLGALGDARLLRPLRRALRVWQAEGLTGVVDRLRRHAWWLPAVDPGVKFEHVVVEIQEASRRVGAAPAFVFFLYLDMMSQTESDCRYLNAHLDAPWGGILFHPVGVDEGLSFRPERYFLCDNARGAAFLDPIRVSIYSRKLPNLHFAYFPDITDATTLGEVPSELIRRVQAAARGRTIVLQFGTLSNKGFGLIEVVRRADPTRFFFAIVGQMFWDSCPGPREELHAFFDQPPENCFVHLGYLPDERELNSLIEASDILYAVYRETFRDSSNTLTKGAVFEKPVLVADSHLMGERVRCYRIGAGVRSGDPASILAGLEALRTRAKSDYCFAAYRRDHSVDALKTALADALKIWLFPTAKVG
jgi:hypothetical protein